MNGNLFHDKVLKIEQSLGRSCKCYDSGKLQLVGSYWGPGSFIGQSLVFHLISCLLIIAVVVAPPDVSGFAIVAGFICFLEFLGLSPRLKVTDDTVTVVSYFGKSVSWARGDGCAVIEDIRPKAVLYFHGVTMPQLVLSDGRQMLLPMFTLDYNRLTRWLCGRWKRILCCPEQLLLT
jgi:hypothetical protein